MNIRLKTSALSIIGAILFCFSSQTNSSLPDITKPYLGEYECKNATLGERDYMSYFDDIRLELKSDETFSLRYQTIDGRKGEETGKYAYNPQTQTICLELQQGVKRCFPLKKGILSISFQIGDKLLNAQFKQR
jgi:hypothetical protein